MKNIFLITSLLMGLNLYAADVPNHLKMSCWDGTFGYNEMQVSVKGQNLEVKLVGHSLATNETLNPTKINGASHTLVIDRSHCYVASADMRIMSCSASDLTLIVRENRGHGDIVHKQKLHLELETKLTVSESQRLGSDWDSIQSFIDDSLHLKIVSPKNKFVPLYEQLYRNQLNPNKIEACGGKITM